MRAFVFTDRALERQAGRFVWLTIDAEKAGNAAFLERFPVEGFPTLLVVDPGTESAVLRWLGSATPSQLGKLLDDGEAAFRGRASGADGALARADRLSGAGQTAEAAAAYREALAGAPPGWPRRERALESLIAALGTSGAREECVGLAREALPADRGPHRATLAAAGLDCALGLEEGAARNEAVAFFEKAARSAIGEPPVAMLADDRSSILGMLVEARKVAGDEAGAREVAFEWLAFLEAEAAGASGPRERAVFDSHILSAALAAGQPERALPALLRSERDLPTDYNPPARLSIAYREAGRLEEALAAADRALALAYGPRKLRVYSAKADALEKMGDREALRATLEEALRHGERLPATQRPEGLLESLRRRLAALAD